MVAIRKQFVFAACITLSIALHANTPQPVAGKPAAPTDTTRNQGNVIFDETGVFVANADAMPVDHFATRLKKAGVKWIALQIDNGGNRRDDNIARIDAGWADQWRQQGFKVGFWGCPRGVGEHNKQASVDAAIPNVRADAILGANLTAKYKGEFYIADCEDGYQWYKPGDPAPALNRVYVDAFMKAAKDAGIANIPRALSSCGRIALDMKPWIETGWDALPQAYWNSYAVYQPSLCVDFYVKEAGWPIGRIHPTIATYTGEGENHPVTLEQYAADLKTRNTIGFSYYLPESYMKSDDFAYKLAAIGKRRTR